VASSNEIEDLFASAVKSVFDPSAVPPAAASPPAQPSAAVEPRRRPRRIRAWAVVLLCLALALVTALIAVVIFHVRRPEIARMAARIQAEYPAVAPGFFKLISFSSSAPETGSSNENRAAPLEGPSATEAGAIEAPATAPAGAANVADGRVAQAPSAENSQTPAASETPGELEAAAAPWLNPKVAEAPTAVPSDAQQPHSAGLARDANPPIKVTAHPAGENHAPGSRSAGVPRVSSSSKPAPIRTGHGSGAVPDPKAGGTAAAGQIASLSRLHTAAGSGTPGAKESKSDSGRASAVPSTANTPAVSAVASASVPESATSASSPSAIVVSSPDHSVYWALEPSGGIFRSIDRKSWEKQNSGVRSDLLAGEAPTTRICWAVGRHGTILLTTDGERWQKINSPMKTDIVSVSALSADVADIVGADGSRLSTFDRGSNWMPTN
jgi:hypothetical protein